MRNYSKVGGRKGMPGYRTPSRFRHQVSLKSKSLKSLKPIKLPKSDREASFKERVFGVVASIPKGQTLTYQKVAEKAGSSKAARAVGNLLNKNNDPNVPCHRVIRSDGTFGGYNQGEEKKKEILEEEGVV